MVKKVNKLTDRDRLIYILANCDDLEKVLYEHKAIQIVRPLQKIKQYTEEILHNRKKINV